MLSGLILSATTLLSTAGTGQENADFASFEVSRLRCVIGNNAAHGEHDAWYNGLFELRAPEQNETAFVPAYAGWNLEHYFDTRPRPESRELFFEPRSAPMTFRQIDAASAELHQPETPYWGVESRTRFTLREPYYLDVDFTCTPKKPLEGGILGCFWASYINGPENKSIYFLEADSSIEKPRWIQFCTMAHDRDSTALPANDDGSISFEPGPPTLYNTISPLRYGAPFFYGRVRNMVLIYIFEPGANIRFSHSPSGGGPTKDHTDTNPAWDFQFIVRQAEPGHEYGFSARLVYKPWTDRADVLAEVRAFLDQRQQKH